MNGTNSVVVVIIKVDFIFVVVATVVVVFGKTLSVILPITFEAWARLFAHCCNSHVHSNKTLLSVLLDKGWCFRFRI